MSYMNQIDQTLYKTYVTLTLRSYARMGKVVCHFKFWISIYNHAKHESKKYIYRKVQGMPQSQQKLIQWQRRSFCQRKRLKNDTKTAHKRRFWNAFCKFLLRLHKGFLSYVGSEFYQQGSRTTISPLTDSMRSINIVGSYMYVNTIFEYYLEYYFSGRPFVVFFHSGYS